MAIQTTIQYKIVCMLVTKLTTKMVDCLKIVKRMIYFHDKRQIHIRRFVGNSEKCYAFRYLYIKLIYIFKAIFIRVNLLQNYI